MNHATKKSMITGTIVFFVAVFFHNAAPQNITGVSELKISAPISPELKKTQTNAALDSLSVSLTKWINSFFENSLDPKNPVSKYFLDRFIAVCKQNVREKSYVEGRNFITQVTVSNTTLDSLIALHNAIFYSKAVNYWIKATEAQRDSNDIALLNALIQSLFYSMGYIGEPMDIGVKQLEIKSPKQLKLILQNILNRLEISFSHPIISGKPPNLPQKDVIVKVTIDSTPFPDFPIVAFRPDGKKVLTAKTGGDGTVSLSNMKIPFVGHGAFLYLQPNISALIDENFTFSAESFGVELTDKNNQTLIFNIIKPVYTLEYNAVPVNKITIPAEFSDRKTIEKFLNDSIYLQPSSKGGNPDLSFNITCQVSSYVFDEKEQTQIKVETKLLISELKENGSSVEKMVTLNEKYYDVSQKIPIGLFFWESSTKLRNLIREALDEL